MAVKGILHQNMDAPGSHPSLNGDTTLFANLYTVRGVGELYQRRSTLL
jgi:hypothetical protein